MILVTRLRSHGKHFSGARKQLQKMHSQTAIATVLIAAVLRAGLAAA
jgi:hypothetical protein